MSRYRLPGPFIALLGLFALTAAPAPAQTPLDTLVMAKDIGDIITFDPGESFEFTAGEILANVYDRIMTFEPEDPGTLTGGVAESHTVSDDGRTITLRIRDGLTFHSGNPVRPEDVEFSLERVVRRGGSPAFILTQLGWNADNVGELVEAVDERHVRINIVEEFSPGLVLHALSAGIGSVVDRELVMAHEQDGDLGAAWLQTKSAGSGPFRLRSWQANESVVLDANPHYRHGAPGVRRVILRHVPEPSSQRLLLERGDVDIARDLTPDLVASVVPDRTRRTLAPFINPLLDEGTEVYTDDLMSYHYLPNHEFVKHSISQYVMGQIHTNGIESFWALMKRGYHGTYHKMSPKHLQRYIDEFSGRHNIRQLDTLMQMIVIVQMMEGKSLTRRELVNGQKFSP